MKSVLGLIGLLLCAQDNNRFIVNYLDLRQGYEIIASVVLLVAGLVFRTVGWSVLIVERDSQPDVEIEGSFISIRQDWKW